VTPALHPTSARTSGLSTALILGLLAAFVAVGIWFYASPDDPAVVTDNRPAEERSTTGAGTQPLPQTPTPPIAPAQPAR
jgi:hypothetical protein